MALSKYQQPYGPVYSLSGCCKSAHAQLRMVLSSWSVPSSSCEEIHGSEGVPQVMSASVFGRELEIASLDAEVKA